MWRGAFLPHFAPNKAGDSCFVFVLIRRSDLAFQISDSGSCALNISIATDQALISRCTLYSSGRRCFMYQSNALCCSSDTSSPDLPLFCCSNAKVLLAPSDLQKPTSHSAESARTAEGGGPLTRRCRCG